MISGMYQLDPEPICAIFDFINCTKDSAMAIASVASVGEMGLGFSQYSDFYRMITKIRLGNTFAPTGWCGRSAIQAM
jgi:hypothetical protein